MGVRDQSIRDPHCGHPVLLPDRTRRDGAAAGATLCGDGDVLHQLCEDWRPELDGRQSGACSYDGVGSDDDGDDDGDEDSDDDEDDDFDDDDDNYYDDDAGRSFCVSQSAGIGFKLVTSAGAAGHARPRVAGLLEHDKRDYRSAQPRESLPVCQAQRARRRGGERDSACRVCPVLELFAGPMPVLAEHRPDCERVPLPVLTDVTGVCREPLVMQLHHLCAGFVKLNAKVYHCVATKRL